MTAGSKVWRVIGKVVENEIKPTYSASLVVSPSAIDHLPSGGVNDWVLHRGWRWSTGRSLAACLRLDGDRG